MIRDPVSILRGHTPIRPIDAARASLGALLGIGAVGLVAHTATSGNLDAVPLLVPPIGASAVLVFAVPASPLAQPRNVVVGNILSALVGAACALLIPYPALAAAAAVAAAVLMMALTGCLHPPGGAVALGAALAGAAAPSAAFGFALVPVGLCSVLLVISGALYAKVTGRSYPHRTPAPTNAHATQDPPPTQRVGFTPADVDAALARYGELLDVSRDDLDALFREVELAAHRRIHSQILCGDIMSRDVITVDALQTAESALALMQQHDLRTAPVIDAERRVVGMARRAELQASRTQLVETVLDPFVHRVQPSDTVQSLLPLLSSGAAHEVMVVDEQRVLRGVITQTDLLAVLYRAHIVEAVTSGRAA